MKKLIPCCYIFDRYFLFLEIYLTYVHKLYKNIPSSLIKHTKLRTVMVDTSIPGLEPGTFLFPGGRSTIYFCVYIVI